MMIIMGDPSSLSREFRTLVTSIRGPLEDELADRGMSAARRERLKSVHRNFMRLLQLVNTLFDVAQSAGGRRTGTELVDSTAQTLIIPRLRDGDPALTRDPAARERGGETGAELHRVNQALAAFSHSVSHDLRGPLQAVDGFSQVLLSDHAHALDGNARDLVEQIHRTAKRMSAIIEDLLVPAQQDPR
jgi:signal transduction histidine kinase